MVNKLKISTTVLFNGEKEADQIASLLVQALNAQGLICDQLEISDADDAQKA